MLHIFPCRIPSVFIVDINSILSTMSITIHYWHIDLHFYCCRYPISSMCMWYRSDIWISSVSISISSMSSLFIRYRYFFGLEGPSETSACSNIIVRPYVCLVARNSDLIISLDEHIATKSGLVIYQCFTQHKENLFWYGNIHVLFTFLV